MRRDTKMTNIEFKAIKNIYTKNLGIRKYEKVLVFTDDYDSTLIDFVQIVAATGNEFSDKVHFLVHQTSRCHGIEPPQEWRTDAFGEKVGDEMEKKVIMKPIRNHGMIHK